MQIWLADHVMTGPLSMSGISIARHPLSHLGFRVRPSTTLR